MHTSRSRNLTIFVAHLLLSISVISAEQVHYWGDARQTCRIDAAAEIYPAGFAKTTLTQQHVVSPIVTPMMWHQTALQLASKNASTTFWTHTAQSETLLLCIQRCRNARACRAFSYAQLEHQCTLVHLSDVGLADNAHSVVTPPRHFSTHVTRTRRSWHVAGVLFRCGSNDHWCHEPAPWRLETTWWIYNHESPRLFRVVDQYTTADGAVKRRRDYTEHVVPILRELGLQAISRSGRSDSATAKSEGMVDVLWGLQWKSIEEFRKADLQTWQMVNMIPGMSNVLLGDKDCFHASATNAIEQFGARYFDFVLPSFVLPLHHEAFMNWQTNSSSEVSLGTQQVGEGETVLQVDDASHAKPNDTTARFDDDDWWIVKQLASWSGQGVSVFASRREAANSALANEGRPVVAQKYVAHPLTLDGHKFDVRWWVVITSVNPLRVYMLRDAYIKVARSVRYSLDDSTKSGVGQDRCMHVTNNAVQDSCTKGRQSRRSKRLFPASIRDRRFARMLQNWRGDPVSINAKWTAQGQTPRQRQPLRRNAKRTSAVADYLFVLARDAITKCILMVAKEMRALKREATPARTWQFLAFDVIYNYNDNNNNDNNNNNTARAFVEEVNTNGFVGGGMLRVKNGRENLKDMFRLVGTGGYNRSAYQAGFEAKLDRFCLAGQCDKDVVLALQDTHDEEHHRGAWERVWPQSTVAPHETVANMFDKVQSSTVNELARLTANTSADKLLDKWLQHES